jgi:hypothetical protein
MYKFTVMWLNELVPKEARNKWTGVDKDQLCPSAV